MKSLNFRLRRLPFPAALVAIAALALPAAASATTFEPNLTGDPVIGGDECTPPGTGNCSLRGAVAAAEDGDTIVLGAATYTLDSPGGDLDVEATISISGAGPASTTIEQTAQDRVIDVANLKRLTMSGLSVTGGDLVGTPGTVPPASSGEPGGEGGGVGGGGIRAAAALALTDVYVIGNKVTGGDGADGADGTGSGGKGGDGGHAGSGGISVGTQTVLTRVAVLGNVSQGGEGGDGGNAGLTGFGGDGGNAGTSSGGIAGGNSPLIATDTTIAGNQALSGDGGDGGDGGEGPLGTIGGKGGKSEASSGGGIFSNGKVLLTNVTISGNVSSAGAAGNGGPAKRLSMSTAGGNGGDGFGGQGAGLALFNGAQASLYNVTVAGNTVIGGTPGEGGAGTGIGPDGFDGQNFQSSGGNVYLSAATLTARGTIFALGSAESGPNCNKKGTSGGYNLDDRNQCLAIPAATDLIEKSAGLGALGPNGGTTETIPLLAGSAAIDAGGASCLDAAGQPLGADQRGEPRGSPCDIGAFELQTSPQTQAGPPVLSGLKLAPKKPRLGKRATITFRLDQDARTTFGLARKAKKKGKGFVKVKKGAPAAVAGTAGPNKLTWKPRKLAPGRYRLEATPAGGSPVAIGFTLRPKKAAKAKASSAGASASFAPPNPTGHWKLSLTIDYSSSGTATNTYCFPNPEAEKPTAVTGSVTDKITVRTVRAPVVEFHEAPNGIPVAMESNYTKAYRGKVSETRNGTLSSGGEPEPCFGTKPPKTDCGTKSKLSGLYVNPLGGIHSWKGFTLELETAPSFERCGLTDADDDLPYPLQIDVKAPPRKLTGHAGKLVFRGSDKGSGQAKDESTSSSASGSVKWKVVLRRAGAGQ